MLLKMLGEVKDVRGKQGIRYDLPGILGCVILALLSGATSYRKILFFMEERYDTLKEALGFEWKKPPSYAGLRLILQNLDKDELEKAFRKYASEVAGLKGGGKRLACDGKALRHSFDRMEDRRAAEILSVFASDAQLILAHVEIEEKSNEIPAFQSLVEDLGLQGKLFTLDALHTQKNP